MAQGGINEPDALGFGSVTKMVKKVLRIGQAVENEDKQKQKSSVKQPKRTREELLSNTYKMDCPRRGKALIFNNKEFAPHIRRQGYNERRGTDVDSTRLSHCLQGLGFRVDKHQNAGSAKMISILDEYASEDHSDADCFVCVLLSHGEPDVIISYDGKVELVDIFQRFDEIHCPTLIGKPKIFIIQACRGRQFDKGKNVIVAQNVTDSKRDFQTAFSDEEIIRIPNEADFLIAHSTVSGYYSWRNSENGSWFIQALVDALNKYDLTTVDFLKLLTYVNRKVAYDFESSTSDILTNKLKQVPAFTSRLTKDLYFWPKIDN